MIRRPFTWKVQLRRGVLDEALGQLRDLPYSLWREVIGTPMRRTVLSRDSHPYELTIRAELTSDDNVRVTVSMKSRGLLGRTILRDGFVITPENKFLR